MPLEKFSDLHMGEGGMLSSTLLNLIVVPVLFTRCGADPARDQLELRAGA